MVILLVTLGDDLYAEKCFEREFESVFLRILMIDLDMGLNRQFTANRIFE
jgi:hypothetical protein